MAAEWRCGCESGGCGSEMAEKRGEKGDPEGKPGESKDRREQGRLLLLWQWEDEKSAAHLSVQVSVFAAKGSWILLDARLPRKEERLGRHEVQREGKDLLRTGDEAGQRQLAVRRRPRTVRRRASRARPGDGPQPGEDRHVPHGSPWRGDSAQGSAELADPRSRGRAPEALPRVRPQGREDPLEPARGRSASPKAERPPSPDQ